MSVHTESSYRLLRKYQYTYASVELYNAHTRRSKDFCGFGDILAFRVITGADLVKFPVLSFRSDISSTYFDGSLAIQACAYGAANEHIRKVILGDPSPFLRKWLECQNRFEVWSFPSPSDKHMKKRYKPHFYTITWDDTARKFHVLRNSTELALIGYELEKSPSKLSL